MLNSIHLPLPFKMEKEQGTRGFVDYGASVTTIDNCRLLVTYRSFILHVLTLTSYIKGQL